MLNPEIILTFMPVAALLGLAPGPDNIFVLTQSAVHGQKAGFAVVAGLCTGLMVHTLAVAGGVAALFQTSEMAYLTLQLAGCGYLIGLAWKAFRASGEPASGENGKKLPLRALYRRGIIMNLTNPKVSVFFLAFLPQFTDPARGSMARQLTLLGLLFIAATLFVFSAMAWAAGKLGRRMSPSPRAQSLLHKTAGVILLGLALNIIAAH